MTRLTYAKMLSADDVDISYITKYYENPKVSHFLSIGDNYFSYVTGTENVHFYKVYSNETLVGVVHLEKQRTSLFLSVLVFPEFQKLGFGTKIIDDVKKDVFGLDYKIIEVSVDVLIRSFDCDTADIVLPVCQSFGIQLVNIILCEAILFLFKNMSINIV